MNNLFIREITIDWQKIPADSYYQSIPSLKGLERLVFDQPITFFTGENGSGKSTLLEGIAQAYGFNAEGGTLNYRFSTYEEESVFSSAIHLIRGINTKKFGYFFRAESFYNVATKEMEYADGNHPSKEYHKMSHGESFLTFFQSYQDSGLFLMDEPEAALSPQRQLTLLIHLYELSQMGAQFMIVTHSPILLAAKNATILSFDEGMVHPITYEETTSYQITKQFIQNKDGFLKHLLEDYNE